MATIEQAIELNENLSVQFDKIGKAIEGVIGKLTGAFRHVQKMESAVNKAQPAGIQTVNSAVQKAIVAVVSIT